MENLIWGADLIALNRSGRINDATNFFGALFGCLKLTLVRVTVLLCALGYSTTRPSLPKRIAIGVAVVSLFYFGAVLVQQYVLVARAAGLPVDDAGALFVEFLVLIANFAYGVWIMIALMAMLGVLKRAGERVAIKYALYGRFSKAFLVLCLCSLIFFIAEASVTFAEWEDESFKVWWLWAMYWEFFYFAVTLTIAILWRPGESNRDYAFAPDGTPEVTHPAAAATRSDLEEVQLDDQSEGPAQGRRNAAPPPPSSSSSSSSSDIRD
jgi:hypothetical protein